ncbi:MAG: hypothetical protein R2695_15735 [Acidimicrobiales bacterium]
MADASQPAEVVAAADRVAASREALLAGLDDLASEVWAQYSPACDELAALAASW